MPTDAQDWPEVRIETWGEFQDAIDLVAVQCVFRGQSSHRWPLCSSFNRLVPCANEETALGWEMTAILNFRREAHLYLPPSVVPPNPFK